MIPPEAESFLAILFVLLLSVSHLQMLKPNFPLGMERSLGDDLHCLPTFTVFFCRQFVFLVSVLVKERTF